MNTLMPIFIVLIFAGLLYFVLPFAFVKYVKYRQGRLAVTKKVVVLTFDDGPGRILTPKVLERLYMHNVKASFFMLGEKIASSRDLVRQIWQAGHDVGAHGYVHKHCLKMTPSNCWKNMSKTYQQLKSTVGKNKYLFRPVGGKVNLISFLFCLLGGFKIVMWTDVSGDTKGYGPPQRKEVIQSIINKGGGIVLLHDFDAPDPRSDYVLAFIDEIITSARSKGLAFMSWSQLQRALHG